jgi:hypothetical protein
MILPFTCLFGALKQSAAVNPQARCPGRVLLASGQSPRDVASIELADLIRISLRMPEASDGRRRLFRYHRRVELCRKSGRVLVASLILLWN